ncbi:hypothetical protein F5Y15DRAFT_402168 [Xylariaceae sp. FL0016]|nr:hypothetical protein F5Y15DRAFT_402168 [Xylariaceae sp. FL0016]
MGSLPWDSFNRGQIRPFSSETENDLDSNPGTSLVPRHTDVPRFHPVSEIDLLSHAAPVSPALPHFTTVAGRASYTFGIFHEIVDYCLSHNASSECGQDYGNGLASPGTGPSADDGQYLQSWSGGMTRDTGTLGLFGAPRTPSLEAAGSSVLSSLLQSHSPISANNSTGTSDSPCSLPEPSTDEHILLGRPGPRKEWIIPQRARRGRKPKAYLSTSRTSCAGVSEHRSRRKGPLETEARRLAKMRRQRGSVCVICHYKKESCTIDPVATAGPCLKCKILAMPCVRYRVTDAALYREQQAPFYLFSQRWKSMDLVDITDWADDEVRSIQISQSFLHAPYEVRVRKFIPMPGDMLEEKWTDRNGKSVTFAVPPYGIVNMEEAGQSLLGMIEREAGNYLNSTVGRLGGDQLIWETYVTGFKRADAAPTTEERSLLFNVLRLWVCCRLSSYPDRIVSEEQLGMNIVDDPISPLHNAVPTPPVIGAQLECIYYTKFLRPLSKKVLQSLMNLIEQRDMKYWYSIYLVLFMMFHSCSLMTRRDMEYARVIALPTLFCNPEGIRGQQTGVRTLLAHFHLILNGSQPFKLALEGRLSEYAGLAHLTQEDVDFVARSASLATFAKTAQGDMQDDQAKANDYYWISQLFDQDWKPDKMD